MNVYKTADSSSSVIWMVALPIATLVVTILIIPYLPYLNNWVADISRAVARQVLYGTAAPVAAQPTPIRYNRFKTLYADEATIDTLEVESLTVTESLSSPGISGSTLTGSTSVTAPLLVGTTSVTAPALIGTTSVAAPTITAANLVATTGLTLPTTGGTASPLTAYSAVTHTTSWTGGMATTAGDISVNWIGRTVVLTLPSISAAGAAASIVSTVALPTYLRPTTAQRFNAIVIDNSTTVYGSGTVQTTGLINLYVGATTTSFTAAGNAGMVAQTITYQLV